MNFDFLKDLCGLGRIYENCSNAEKLAVTMPVQSVFTSRKSAESLAKFIYMTAHKQEMENLSFADILSDSTVRKFINNREVMDAFHYIRKSGNRAVHEDEQESPEEAISVLQDLHYVVGETACMLGLIKGYPMFESDIAAFPEAKFVDNGDINKEATEMFLAYVDNYNAWQEREKYIEVDDHDLLDHVIEGNVEMHEYLAFKFRPKQTALLEYIQKYILTLARLSVERSPERAEELKLSDPVTLDAEITIGDSVYKPADIDAFCRAVIEELPKANGFSVDLTCNGVLREFFCDEDAEDGSGRINLIRKDSVWTGVGMLDTLEMYKRRNAFEYKLSVFYPDRGEYKCEKILDGKEIDVLSTGSEAIIDLTVDEEWWSWNLSLYADFDAEKYHDELLKLQDIVRTSIPGSEIPYCEEAWADGDSHILCNGIQWNCRSLREVQDFLDKINAVLLPLKDEVTADCDGTWEVRGRFAVATWKWTEDGFKILGTEY